MKKEPNNPALVCIHCKHYYITHDPHFIYGCRAFNFKSKRQPILDVVEASGQQCAYFQQKKERVRK